VFGGKVIFRQQHLWSASRLAKAVGRLASIGGLVAAAHTTAMSQDHNAAGLKDEIFARKILMDTIDHHMDAIDWMLNSGKPVDLAEASGHADTISVMLMAFPHLFPAGTNQWQPNSARNPARDTFASPQLWTNFSDFYQRAAAASKLAYNASRARRESDLRNFMASLRAACDSCHALYVKTDQ
jgi:cytochrome c556